MREVSTGESSDRPESRKAFRLDRLFDHVDGAAGALFNAYSAAFAVIVVELITLPRPKFDHSIVGADTIAVVALKTIPSPHTPPPLQQSGIYLQAADHFIEA